MNPFRVCRGPVLWLALVLLLTLKLWAPPAWWAERAVLAGTAADDYAALNQGQLKNFVRGAVDEMNARLPGGAGAALNNLVAGWRANSASADDFAAANVGQLKAMGKMVRARLAELNLSVPPLGTATTDDDDNFALANLGQAKTVFNIAIESGDTDGNGVNDAWELEHFGTLARDLSLDTDGDGVSDHDEWLAGTDPNDWRSRPGATEQGTVMLAVYTPVVR